MKSNPVVHFEIYVENMARAKAFYEAVLETRLEHMPSPNPDMEMEMWFFPMDKESGMSSYGAGGMLVKMEGFTPEQRFFLSYGRIWASNVAPQFVAYLVNSDTHSPNNLRVNAAEGTIAVRSPCGIVKTSCGVEQPLVG